jgi:hypothetical protein
LAVTSRGRPSSSTVEEIVTRRVKNSDDGCRRNGDPRAALETAFAVAEERRRPSSRSLFVATISGMRVGVDVGGRDAARLVVESRWRPPDSR